MNDLQAIDRAHRIGQKNVLNVYRLIMKDTLEEKIMGIQKFKLNIANAIINVDNASIHNVQGSSIVELFDQISKDDKKPEGEKNQDGKFMPFAKILGQLSEDGWQERKYNQEYWGGRFVINTFFMGIRL